jgi:hypothetical protein
MDFSWFSLRHNSTYFLHDSSWQSELSCHSVSCFFRFAATREPDYSSFSFGHNGILIRRDGEGVASLQPCNIRVGSRMTVDRGRRGSRMIGRTNVAMPALFLFLPLFFRLCRSICLSSPNPGGSKPHFCSHRSLGTVHRAYILLIRCFSRYLVRYTDWFYFFCYMLLRLALFLSFCYISTCSLLVFYLVSFTRLLVAATIRFRAGWPGLSVRASPVIGPVYLEYLSNACNNYTIALPQNSPHHESRPSKCMFPFMFHCHCSTPIARCPTYHN